MTDFKKPNVFPKEEPEGVQFDKLGREIPDPTVIALTLNLGNAVKTGDQKLKEKVAQIFNQIANVKGYETIDEANDFDMGDSDSVALSGYEYNEEALINDEPPTPVETTIKEDTTDATITEDASNKIIDVNEV